LRTAHIAVTSVLFGGHVFAVEAPRLLPWLYLVVLTGGLLLAVEAFRDWRWCYQARGLMVIAKVILTALAGWIWPHSVAFMIAVIAIGSVGSHMPRRFRHYSLLDHRVTGKVGSY
jgi:hypothetical protein